MKQIWRHAIVGKYDLNLAKQSCNHCYGTGIAGKLCSGELKLDPTTGKADYTIKTPLTCACVVRADFEKKEEEKLNKEKQDNE